MNIIRKRIQKVASEEMPSKYAGGKMLSDWREARELIREHNSEFGGRCLDDTNPLQFVVKFKDFSAPCKEESELNSVFTFTSANKAFGDYGGYSVFARCINPVIEKDMFNGFRIERELTNSNIEWIKVL